MVHTGSGQIQQSLLDAISRIEEASGVEVSYSDGPGAIQFKYGDVPGTGRWNPFTRTVTLRKSLSGVGLDVVTLHELLHGLGCDHVEEGKGVLTPRPVGPLKLTSDDLEELCFHQRCIRFIPE